MNAPRLAQLLDLFAEESQRYIYAGELEVRPPTAWPFSLKVVCPMFGAERQTRL